MAKYFVTRHKGAVDWAKKQGINAEHLPHFNPEIINSGDTVIGTLPVQLAASVCEKGGKYLHLSLNLTPDMRGKELTVEDMENAGATLQEFSIKKID